MALGRGTNLNKVCQGLGMAILLDVGRRHTPPRVLFWSIGAGIHGQARPHHW